MNNVYGINELKTALIAVAAFGTALGKVYEDGDVDLFDAKNIFVGLKSLVPLASVKLVEAKNQALELNDAEGAELVAAFKQAFDLPVDGTEVQVEEALALALSGLVLIAELKSALGKKVPLAA